LPVGALERNTPELVAPSGCCRESGIDSRRSERVGSNEQGCSDHSILIYHITTAGEAQRAVESGEYTAAGFEREGFIHCSYSHQVPAVAGRLFQGQTNLVLLEIDPQLLDCRVVDENLEGGTEVFPHIYGRLKMSAVVQIRLFLQ
jgi:uncharacterized protein (DUF952 family)